MIFPPRLRAGDPIAVIAPAGPVPEERMRAGLALLAQRYDVRTTQRIYARSGYLAGDDDARADELIGALSDPSLRAIVCARGGYGVMRILSRLDPRQLAAQPKTIVGFSDITALHAYAQRANVVSIHGPVATQLGELSADDQAALFTLLEGSVGAPLENLRSVGAAKIVDGPLYGGNLELVTRLIGTPWAFDLNGAVLLLEEIGERPYRIDRALTQLELSGALARVAGIIVGDLLRCTEPDGSGPSAEEVVIERTSRLGVPVLLGLPVGHGAKNRALALGARVRVNGSRGRVEPLEPATR